MAIIYVARLTRPDVHITTAYLATKAQHPKEGDYKAALRIISYLHGTTSYGIVVNCRELKFHLHCDASWASHHDGSSHTEWVLKLGESFLGSKSSKQRVGSPSSADAEIISTVDGLKNLNKQFAIFVKIISVLPRYCTNLQKQSKLNIC